MVKRKALGATVRHLRFTYLSPERTSLLDTPTDAVFGLTRGLTSRAQGGPGLTSTQRGTSVSQLAFPDAARLVSLRGVIRPGALKHFFTLGSPGSLNARLRKVNTQLIEKPLQTCLGMPQLLRLQKLMSEGA